MPIIATPRIKSKICMRSILLFKDSLLNDRFPEEKTVRVPENKEKHNNKIRIMRFGMCRHSNAHAMPKRIFNKYTSLYSFYYLQ